ncbi:MAG: polysaccharide biosynthesis tyrosine autokinase [Burkholderiaceae bacterium]
MKIEERVDPDRGDHPVTVIHESADGELAKVVDEDRHAIGAMLVSMGAMTPTEVHAVLERQDADERLFGEIARDMGLVTSAQLDEGIAAQFNAPFLSADLTRSLSPTMVAAHRPSHPFVEQLRGLRRRLSREWFNAPHRRCLAVCGVGHGEGRTHVAANLAAVFAQRGDRVLLIDADLRRGQVQKLFRMPRSRGLAGILAGRSSKRPIKSITGLPGLSVLPSGPRPPNPSELLGTPVFARLLAHLSPRFSMIIIDTGAACESADGQLVADVAGAAIIVARSHQTAVEPLRRLGQDLLASGVHVPGVVYNDG